jgi:nitronate monooxygenase
MIPERLRRRLKLPVMAAPLFLVSGPDLVVEACKAGVVGAFPTLNQRTAEGFEAWLIEIRRRLPDESSAPFAPMFGIHRTNPRQAPDLALAIKYQAPIVITTFGITREIVDAIHAYGGFVFHDATTVRHAIKALKAGVDGIIAVTQGAGGHAGTYNPFAFLAELRPIVGNKTLILAGAMSNGQAIAGAIAAGADMASLGTRFVATKESMAPNGQKEMIISSSIEDIVFTDEISGISASFLKQTIMKFRRPQGGAVQFNVAEEISPKVWKDYWSAGQGVGAVTEILSVRALCEQLMAEYQSGVARLVGTQVGARGELVAQQ